MRYLVIKTDFGIFKLLLYVVNEAIADLADEATKQQLRLHLARPRDSPTYTHQGPNLIGPQIPNTRDQRQMIKRDIKLTTLQISRVRRGSSRVYLKIIRFVLCDKVEEGAAEVWEETVVLFLDRVCEDVIFLEKMAIVYVEGCEFIFAHCVDLLDVDEFAICDFREIAIGGRGRGQSDLFGETEWYSILLNDNDA